MQIAENGGKDATMQNIFSLPARLIYVSPLLAPIVGTPPS
jgi:hypothetical protein